MDVHQPVSGLQVSQATVHWPRPDRAAAGLLERARLVVAHPDAVVRASWCQLVELWGMKVVGTAAAGAEAVDVARATRPGVVLLDSGLQGLPAEEVAHLVVATLDADVVLAMAPPAAATDHGQRIQVLRTPISPWEMRRAIFQRVWMVS